jgi:hypothetical protein
MFDFVKYSVITFYSSFVYYISRILRFVKRIWPKKSRSRGDYCTNTIHSSASGGLYGPTSSSIFNVSKINMFRFFMFNYPLFNGQFLYGAEWTRLGGQVVIPPYLNRGTNYKLLLNT